MKALIDIGHPAHVHYFRNFIRIFEAKGNQVKVTARKKEMSHELLDLYKIPYVSRGTGSNSMLGKLMYLPKGNRILLQTARKFKPDIFLSFSSPYAAQVSTIMGKPHIAFDDTEHAKLGRLLYRPFTNLVLSPKSYNGKISSKQKLFDGYMELLYLHPKHFTPRTKVKDLLKVKENEKYTILRFVSWDANHDLGHSGISLEMKRKIVKELSKQTRVFISSEAPLPPDLEPYRFRISPDWMHDALYYSELFFGESATMASEAAMLGTPAIYLDDVGRGYTDELETQGMVFNFTESQQDQQASLKKALEILIDLTKASFQKAHQAMLASKIDVTTLLLEEIDIMKRE
ncbi:DUF354 domain-containing protein [Roseivirga sp.]|uniref:DUF354 domain-containing protein n=1 Tax=Roseivirga sp. TaxID=1964215 RepID=UPI003B8DC7B0